MSFSQNTTNHNLMGFSVHQPAIGAALQFFPAMGSTQLDEMINAYVPGNASILDKRTVVTCEFVQHSMATGELFKFFMVYPSHASDSFESPVSLQDSGYGSFNTSPVMSESQWTNASASSSSKVPSPTQKSTAADFSHMPGMKIMTREGIDVTNSASRGCKTKEQRDHAHLMRIIKACEACRKKKIRCDPSHKKRSSHSLSPEPKASKKARKSPSVAPKATPQAPTSNQCASIAPIPFAGSQGPPAEANNPSQWDAQSFDTAFVPADEVDIFAEMESWDQFINYEDEPATVHNDWSFNADQFSPTTTFTSSTSPSQPRIPAMPELASNGFGFASAANITANGGADYSDVFASGEVAPALPYLNPGGVERNRNYIDFNLYSPGSSCDEEFGYSKDIAAASPLRAASPRHAARPAAASPQESSQYFGTLDRGHDINGVDTDLPYDRTDDHRHKAVSDSTQAISSQARQPVYVDPSQAFAAGAYQATTAAGAARTTALSSLHEQARSSSRQDAYVAPYTGLARPDEQQVPADQRSQSLIPSDVPVIPGRPRGEDGERAEREKRGGGRTERGGRNERRNESSIAQTSGVNLLENAQSRVTQSSSLPRLGTSTTSSAVSLVVSAFEVWLHDSVDLRDRMRGQQQSVSPKQWQSPFSQSSKAAPDRSTAESGAWIVREGRASVMPQPGLQTTLARTGGRSFIVERSQTQLSKARASKSQNSGTSCTSSSEAALDYSYNAIGRSVIAAVGISDAAVQQPMLTASLSAAALLWSMSGRNAHSENAGQLQPDKPAKNTSTFGEGWMAKVASQLTQTSTLVYCLAALILAPVAMRLLHIVAPIVVLAMTSVMFLQTIAPRTDNPTAHAQPLSATRRSRIQTLHSAFGAKVCDLAQRLSQLHSSVGRKLSPQPSNKRIRGGSWQIPIL